MYADYNGYLSGYLMGRAPTVPEADFAYWEKAAEREIDAYTYGRLKRSAGAVPDEVRDCSCAITELLYKADQMENQTIAAGMAGPLTSYSNDGESGTYDLGESVYTVSGRKAEIRRLIHTYLGATGLLYAGVNCCRRHAHES